MWGREGGRGRRWKCVRERGEDVGMCEGSGRRGGDRCTCEGGG